jgi:hypothetical protein
MTSTRLVADPSRGPETPIRGYVGTARSGFRPWHWTAHMAGEGGVWSTLDDLVRWLGNFADPQVGSRELLERMMTPNPLADGSPNPYACGLKLGELNGHRWASHSGGFDGYRSQTVWFPSSRLGVAVLANQTVDPTDAALAAADLVLARLDGSADRAPGLAGSYRSAELDTLCRVAVADDQLLLSVAGPSGTVESVARQRAGPDRYSLTRSARAAWDLEFETSFTFLRSDDGAGRALVIDCEWARHNVFERVVDP